MSGHVLTDDTKWEVYQHADEHVIYADDILWHENVSLAGALDSIKEFIEEEYIAEATVKVYAYGPVSDHTVKADLDAPEDMLDAEELKALKEAQKPELGKW
jgi:S-methylmethionine-dependent homocysteine/selenocysteine methylase